VTTGKMRGKVWASQCGSVVALGDTENFFHDIYVWAQTMCYRRYRLQIPHGKGQIFWENDVAVAVVQCNVYENVSFGHARTAESIELLFGMVI